jgi:hypothetical protein
MVIATGFSSARRRYRSINSCSAALMFGLRRLRAMFSDNVIKRCRLDLFPGIGHRKLKKAMPRPGGNFKGLVRRSVMDSIADDVRSQLANPGSITVNGIGHRDATINHAIRRARLQLRDDLTE